jgi:hypothetical protein
MWGGKEVKREIALMFVLTLASLFAACGGADTTTNTNTETNTNATSEATGSPHRDGLVDTNVNMSPNTSGDTVSTNTAVVTNNNNNDNTSGISTMNTNEDKRGEKKKRTGAGQDSSH